MYKYKLDASNPELAPKSSSQPWKSSNRDLLLRQDPGLCHLEHGNGD